MKEQNTEIDYGVIGLILTLLVVMGILSFNLGQAKKKLKDTTDVVYYVSDRLDISQEMISLLKEEQSLMKQEIEQMKRIQRITKELR